jgi:hypothetical protein
MQPDTNDNSGPAGRASGILQRLASHAALRRSPASLRRLLSLVLASGVLLAAGSNVALAQVQVGGQPEAVHIEAKDATLREVLDALHANFKLGYRTNDGLDTRMTGTFNGPLQQVAARVLNGYDFVMKITPQGIDILILRQNEAGGAVVVASARATKSPPQTTTAVEANRKLAR